MTNIKWDQGKAVKFHEAINSEASKESTQKAVYLLETSIESALRTFNDSVFHAAECLRRTIWFNTGTERGTNKWFDRKCVTKKRDARRALNRFKKTKSDVDKQIHRQKRAEYKLTVKEKKQQYKASVHQALLDNKRNSCTFWDTV